MTFKFVEIIAIIIFLQVLLHSKESLKLKFRWKKQLLQIMLRKFLLR